MDTQDRARSARPQAPPVSPLPLWWSRDFPGQPSLIRQARSWLAGLLPACDPLDDLLLFADELATNAVLHTRSGEPGGWFTIDVTWSAESARVAVGDQGSDEVPPSAPVSGGQGSDRQCSGGQGPGDRDAHLESGRGLRIINALSAAWGIAGDAAGRWLWADVDWRSSGGFPPTTTPGDNPAYMQFATICRDYPGTAAWYDHRSGQWCAALRETQPEAHSARGTPSTCGIPCTADLRAYGLGIGSLPCACGIPCAGSLSCISDTISAPSPTALTSMLAARYQAPGLHRAPSRPALPPLPGGDTA